MDSVDDILEPLTEDYVTLYKENSVLKSRRCAFLWKSWRNYRKQGGFHAERPACRAEEAMRPDGRGRRKKCAQMLHEAEGCRQRQDEQCRRPCRRGAERLDAAKAATSQFLDGMEERLKRQLELIDELRRGDAAPPSQPEEPERVHRFTPPVEPQTPC